MPEQHRARNVRLPPSANIKLGLLALSVLTVIGVLVYSNQLVGELKVREQRVAKLFADALSHFRTAEEPDAILYQLIVDYTRNSGVPVLLTDKDDMPTFSLKSYAKFSINVPLDTTLDSAGQLAFLKEEMSRMDAMYPPDTIYYKDLETGDSMITNYVHYGDSRILSKIEELPFIQLLLGAVVVIIGYLSFSYLKRSEQSNIWVGMSKETAHQLGTPLSSLLGWTEMLRLSANDPDKVREIAGEIEHDTIRLNRIAVRFSKIGAAPDLKEQNIVEVVSAIMGYLEDRFPKLGHDISFSLETTSDEIHVQINRELFEWVIENLVKNAVEAIESPAGSIHIHITAASNQKVIIDVTDSGKGLDSRQRKDVFRPGYSTKSRGWGLGLTLSKRIIEEYHHGKLFVKETNTDKGTTFRIILQGSKNGN
jgi:signal transduction histidine kinase